MSTIDEKPVHPLRVIPVEAIRTRRLAQERRKLFPAALMGLLGYGILSLVFFIAEKRGWIALGGVVAPSFAGMVRAMVGAGFIPLIVASVILAVAKPPGLFITGQVRNKGAYLFAPLLSALSAAALWCARELLVTWFPAFGRYVALPLYLQDGKRLLGTSPTATLLVLTATVVIPATAEELFARGLVQPALIDVERPLSASIQIALVLSLARFDLSGVVLLLTGSLMASWIRQRSDSLLASSLASAGYGLALLMSDELLDLSKSSLLFDLTVGDTGYRVFLITCLLFLSLFLIAPMAFFQSRVAPAKDTAPSEENDVSFFKERRRRRFAAVLVVVLLAALFVAATYLA